jgi:uncharacterized beta-barrel protein YwiB (DUF1934 family)
MMKDVVISINSTFAYEDGEEQRMEFSTDGYYFYEDQVGCLSYEETEVTGMEGTRTSLFVMPDQVVVDREGTVTSRMVFKEGLKSAFQFATPFGNANMGIDTRRIRQNMGEGGGRVEIDYVVNMEHVVASRNRFEITVREISPQ